MAVAPHGSDESRPRRYPRRRKVVTFAASRASARCAGRSRSRVAWRTSRAPDSWFGECYKLLPGDRAGFEPATLGVLPDALPIELPKLPGRAFEPSAGTRVADPRPAETPAPRRSATRQGFLFYFGTGLLFVGSVSDRPLSRQSADAMSRPSSVVPESGAIRAAVRGCVVRRPRRCKRPSAGRPALEPHRSRIIPPRPPLAPIHRACRIRGPAGARLAPGVGGPMDRSGRAARFARRKSLRDASASAALEKHGSPKSADRLVATKNPGDGCLRGEANYAQCVFIIPKTLWRCFRLRSDARARRTRRSTADNHRPKGPADTPQRAAGSRASRTPECPGT